MILDNTKTNEEHEQPGDDAVFMVDSSVCLTIKLDTFSGFRAVSG